MTPPKSKVPPHLFQPDPDIPPGLDGRGACSVCHLVGQAGDAHHTLPEVPAQAEHLRRYDAGEDGNER